jgi:hypothetical protein
MFKSFARAMSLTIIGALLAAGCGSAPQTSVRDVQTNIDEWWNNPGAIQDHLAAIGTAPLLNARAEGPARTYAEADGRSKLAATLKARINQLVENWSKDVGDLNREASFSSLINNEAITRQFVETEVRGAMPYKYQNTGSNMYVLMVLKNPEQWAANLVDSLRDQALQEETLFRTEVMKNDFRKRMDDLRNEEVNKVRAQRQAFEQAAGGGATQ